MNTAELNALFINYYHLEEAISFPEIAGLNVEKDDMMAVMRGYPNAYDAFVFIHQYIAERQRHIIELRLNTNRDLSASY
jgi:hypothetical protein